MIGHALLTNSTLKRLNLRHNSLGYLGGKSLTDVLVVNRTIEVLVISDNRIGSEIATMFGGRLHGGTAELNESVTGKELDMPLRYESGRYDRSSLAQLIQRRKNIEKNRIENHF